MILKDYQTATLDVLKNFFEEARIFGPKVAYEKITSEEEQAKRLRGYGGTHKPIKQLEAVPYVCLRLPTGGGKTLLATHSITIARDKLLEKEYPLVVWLVPSDAIRTQTVEALKNNRHPYRQSLDDAFEGRVRVFDIADFTQLTPSDLRANLCVFVGTIQTLKITNTNGRKVYAHNEMMEPHFSSIPPGAEGLEHNAEGPFKGDIKFSFANLLHLNNPLVIVDEAHNAVTGLAEEMQRRINPAAIIEFTATPKGRSNILHSVSAQELKAEQMIKLPVVLEEHESWQSAVNGAVLRRAELAEEAKNDRDDYIRPIVLFQAQNRDKEVTVEVLRDHLIGRGIPEEQIAIATGKQRELDGLNLFDPACKIEYVITVQALKEGWDCSFAYVFCSVANIQNARDAEQLLGRVLRMPYAKRRKSEKLNKAYACLTSKNFAEAAKGLVDKLIDMGFDENEAIDNVQSVQPELADDLFGRQRRKKPQTTITIDAPFAEIKNVETAAPEKISVSADENGKAKLSVNDFLTPKEKQQVYTQIPTKFHQQIDEEISRFEHEHSHEASPAQLGKEFIVPALMAHIQGELELADTEILFEYHDWSLKDHSHQLSEQEFSLRQTADTFEIDLDGDTLVYHHADQTNQLMLDIDVEGWTKQGLVLWLDKKVRNQMIAQDKLVAWLSALVNHLINQRNIPLSALMRCQYILARKVEQKLSQILADEHTKIYQHSLFSNQAQPEISFENGFNFFDGMFAGQRMYSGRYRFTKHYSGWDQVPAFDGTENGEEYQCAEALDSLPEVKYWVRNVAKHQNAFWLPLAHGKFYPDFVAKLKDGRIFVIEYKGAHLINDPATIQKQAVGEIWQSSSTNNDLFLMVEKQTDGRGMRDQMLYKIESAPPLHQLFTLSH